MKQLTSVKSLGLAFWIGIFIYLILVSISFGQITNDENRQLNTADIIISEIAHTSNSSYNFIELYNPTNTAINLSNQSYYLSRIQSNGLNEVALTGTIPAKGTYVCSIPYSWFIIYWKLFLWEYGIDPDQQNSAWAINGSTNFAIYKNGNSQSGTLIDIYGELNSDDVENEWDYINSHAVRKRIVASPNSVWTASEWLIKEASMDQYSPGQHAADIYSNSDISSWNTRGNWSGRGYVPDASTVVTILPEQIISINAASVCDQLIIEEDAQLLVSPNSSLITVDTIINQAGIDGFVLQSNETGTSSLIHDCDSIEASVQSYFSDLEAWYLIASPIIDAKADVFFGQYLDMWSEPEASWQAVEDANELLIPGKGYSLKKSGDQMAFYMGYLNSGSIIIDSLRFTESNDPSLRGWNLIGNPYPSVLDFNKVDLSSTSINAGISVWPHNGTTVSSYRTWSQGGGSPIGDDEARYVQPGQGFMIQVTDDMQSFEMTNDCRTHRELGCIDKGQKRASNDDHTLVIEISGEATTIDKTYFGIRENATVEFDINSDVRKMFGAAINPHIFSFGGASEEETFAINCIGIPEIGSSYPLGIRPGINGEYLLKVSGINSFEESVKIWLLDTFNDHYYDLDQDSIISFYYQNGDTEKRFELVFDDEVGINNSSLITSDFTAYVSNSRLYLSGIKNDGKETVVQIYDLLGQKILEQSASDAQYGIYIDLPAAYYMVCLKNEHGFWSQKIFII